MRNLVLGFFAVISLTACHSVGNLDQGLIELNEPKSHFVNAWGLPDRQYTKSGDELMKASVGSGGGSFFKGKLLYDVWVYESRKTQLVFDSQKRLAGYMTELNRQELQDTYIGPPPRDMSWFHQSPDTAPVGRDQQQPLKTQ